MVFSITDKTFAQEVLESSVPVLVHFWAPWCGPCRMINPMLTRFKEEWGEKVKLVSINADENFKLSNTYRLTTLPTLLWVEGGQVIHRVNGFQKRDELRAFLEKIMSGSSLQAESLTTGIKVHP